jgi:hypothetical protein
MFELEEVWAQKLEEAIGAARAAGRDDIAEFLTLKATNDAVRQTGVHWLFGAMLENALLVPQIKIENEAAHRFTLNNATMVGAMLRLRLGVRCLTIEAGWTRAPGDGFMRGGALAAARLTHFGMARENAELLLIKRADEAPNWFAVKENGERVLFGNAQINHHFRIFLGEL